MTRFNILLFFFFFTINCCKAQDTAVVLSSKMFNESEQISLAIEDGWVFKQGNDSGWAKKDIDTSGWKNLKPTELSAKYADKNGRAEGWFRLKIRPDSSFENKPIGFSMASWAAIDLYVDGKLISSSGNTGINGKPFEESTSGFKRPVSLNLQPGINHSIALHFVDHLGPFPPQRLKSEDIGLETFITINSTNYDSSFVKNITERNSYMVVWASVCTILSLLFWILYFLNLREKDILLISICTTFFAFSAIGIAGTYLGGISYTGYMICSNMMDVFLQLIFVIIPLILANIFKRKVTRALKAFLFFLLVSIVVFRFLPEPISTILPFIEISGAAAISIYYLVSSWKKLKGAPWAVVAGLLLTIFWVSLFLIIFIMSNGEPTTNGFLYLSAVILSFPLSLLVYVAIRFKETVNEVQQNAKQVMLLSEEKKENAVNQQKVLQQEVNRQTSEIKKTLENLKSTQKQLIQSEKMASLGELTAGIAHEIQNPLNFVNNFSDINAELLDELKAERLKPKADRDTQLEDEILNDIKANEEKINHHGKRADAIVKGMLQHSKSTNGQKEPTDINALADEYLRLSYHGLRSKDKTFNATLKTDFDESLSADKAGIGKINIIPQDIGRVLLNLINNAFYAVAEKKKQQPENYEPTVSVTTKKSENSVLITVSDNGNGISQKILDKIFQPFFTTKPTGEGTGLGLSLAYDIIKAHGGELKVETMEGEGSEFIIQLPIV